MPSRAEHGLSGTMYWDPSEDLWHGEAWIVNYELWMVVPWLEFPMPIVASIVTDGQRVAISATSSMVRGWRGS